MRRQIRELNIFSLSALDLFAGALGAFMLLMLIFIPFFPNTSFNSGKSLRIPDLDMVIAVDTTGSMGEVVKSLQGEIGDFAALIQQLTPSVAIGLIDFDDRCDPSTALRGEQLTLVTPTSLPALEEFARSLERGGPCNPDDPENLAAALDAAIAQPWRPEATARVIVVVSDNPSYPEYEASSLAAARRFAAGAPGYRVSSVFVCIQAPCSEAGRRYLRQLAEAGNGHFVESSGSFTAPVLLSLRDL